MLGETHKIIAKQMVSDGIFNDVNINEKAFIKGTVYADLHPRYKVIPHYYSKSHDIVEKVLASMIVVSKYMGANTNFYSFRLGVMSHYLMDYCCQMHKNEQRFHNVKDAKGHYQYEKELNIKAKTHTFSEVDTEIFTREKVEDYRDYIGSQLAGYLLEYHLVENSMETDLNYAYTLCKRMLEYVLAEINSTEVVRETSLTKRKTLKLVRI